VKSPGSLPINGIFSEIINITPKINSNPPSRINILPTPLNIDITFSYDGFCASASCACELPSWLASASFRWASNFLFFL
jgi:hypothetical protein